jgi:hypothetical protein
MKTKTGCHEIAPNPSRDRTMPEGIIFRFEINLQNLLFSWQFNYIRISKQVPKYLATGL